MIQQKVWGTTSPLIRRQNFEVHRIVIDSGGYCSKHYHEAKSNAFYVECGELLIHVWNEDSDTQDTTRLRAGDMTTVPPKKLHQFEAVADTVCYEIYWTQISEDIIRKTYGGFNGNNRR